MNYIAITVLHTDFSHSCGGGDDSGSSGVVSVAVFIFENEENIAMLFCYSIGEITVILK